MWRPFASNIAKHTFENFVKKNRDQPTAPARPKKIKGKAKSTDLYPYKHSPQELETRQKQFEQLVEYLESRKLDILMKDRQTELKTEKRRQDIRLHNTETQGVKSVEMQRVRELATTFQFKSRRRDGGVLFKLTAPKIMRNSGFPRQL